MAKLQKSQAQKTVSEKAATAASKVLGDKLAHFQELRRLSMFRESQVLSMATENWTKVESEVLDKAQAL